MSIGQEVFAQLEEHLNEAGVPYRYSEAGVLEIVPEGSNTFEIAVIDEGDEVIVSASKWHSHFESAEDAVSAAMWLLTPFYRVVEEYQGDTLLGTWLETYGPTGWSKNGGSVWSFVPEAVLKKIFTRHKVHYVTQQAVLSGLDHLGADKEDLALDDHGRPPGTRLGRHLRES